MPQTPVNLAHEYVFHGLDPRDVLHGEILIIAMDKFSLLAGLIPPSNLYSVESGGQSSHPNLSIEPDAFAVQIPYSHRHYLVSNQKNGKIYLYNRLPNPNRTNVLLKQLFILYKLLQTDPNPIEKVTYIVSQFQGTSVDCGVFAGANALLLISGQDPQSTVLNQPALRQHLFYCLESDSAVSNIITSYK